MPLKVLLIDDLRDFRESHGDGVEVSIARNSTDGLKLLQSEPYWDYVYLDHDLGMDITTWKEDTIGPVIDFLAEEGHEREEAGEPLRVGRVIIHTSNPVGAQMMNNTLKSYGYETTRIDPATIFVAQPAPGVE